MTSVLSPLAPMPPPARDASAVPVSTAIRPMTPATGAESARAPHPVDAIAAEDRLRNPAARERPVGPPPSFDINVLQDIRARQRSADTDDPAIQGEAPDDAQEPPPPPDSGPVAAPGGGSYGALTQMQEQGEHLDHVV